MGYDKRGRPKLDEPKTQHNVRLIAHYGELLKPGSPIIAWRCEKQIRPIGIQQADKLTRPWNPSTLVMNYLNTEMEYLLEYEAEWLWTNMNSSFVLPQHWLRRMKPYIEVFPPKSSPGKPV